MNTITKVQQNWEADKKAQLVALGQSIKPYNEILTFLETEISQSMRMASFDYSISCFKNDGIYQLSRAIEEIIGTTNIQQDRSPSGDRAMQTIDIQLANGTRKKVPYGDIDLPEMGDGACISIGYDTRMKILYVNGTCQFKFQYLIDQIIDRTHELLKTDSIYKHQAFEIDAAKNEGQPTVIDLTAIDKEIMIVSDEVEYQMAPLKVRILQPEKCLSRGIPLKFGALMEGPYGL